MPAVAVLVAVLLGPRAVTALDWVVLLGLGSLLAALGGADPRACECGRGCCVPCPTDGGQEAVR